MFLGTYTHLASSCSRQHFSLWFQAKMLQYRTLSQLSPSMANKLSFISKRDLSSRDWHLNYGRTLFVLWMGTKWPRDAFYDTCSLSRPSIMGLFQPLQRSNFSISPALIPRTVSYGKTELANKSQTPLSPELLQTRTGGIRWKITYIITFALSPIFLVQLWRGEGRTSTIKSVKAAKMWSQKKKKIQE